MKEHVKSIYEKLVDKKLKPLTKINNSLIYTHKECDWLYKLQRLGVRSRIPSIPLKTGSLLHVGMAVMYGKRIVKPGKRFNKMIRIFEQKWSRNLAVNVTSKFIERMDRQFAVIKGILYGMAYQHKIERDLDLYEIVQIESKISGVPLLYGVKLYGTPDVVMRDRKTKELVIMDHKSTSVIDEDYRKRMDVSAELQSDKQLVQFLFKEPVNKGFYNVLQKFNIYQKKTESRSDFHERMMQLYMETEFHYRFPADLSTNQPWLSNIHQRLQIISYQHENNYFPMNDNSCVKFWRCSMLDFCSSRKDSVFKTYYHFAQTEKDAKKKS